MSGRLENLPKTEAYTVARNTLPDGVRQDYDTLVQWYSYLAKVHHGRPYVSYKILADLVREGWRQSAVPIETKSDLEGT